MTYALVHDQTAIVDTSNSGTFTPGAAITAGHGYTILISTSTIDGVASMTASNGDVIDRVTGMSDRDSSSLTLQVFCCRSSAGGTPTITINNSAGDSSLRYDFTEWNQPLGAFRTSSGAGGVTPSPSTSVAYCTAIVGPGDLALAVYRGSAGTWGTWPTSGWTSLAGSTSAISHYEYLAVATGGDATPSVTFPDASTIWVGLLMVFYPPVVLP